MYCRALACDLDGTGATNGQLAPEVAAALGTARVQGIVTLLVTGRVLEDVQGLCPDLSMFDAIVAENGALVYLPDNGRTIQLGRPPPDQFLGDLASPRWQVFTPGPRVTAHTHHARKYADTHLPEDKAFRFLHTDGMPPAVAHNMIEFHTAVQSAPLASLRHHLMAGDLSRWVAGILGDEPLARGLRKLERAALAGALPNRDEILAHIEEHYFVESSRQARAPAA